MSESPESPNLRVDVAVIGAGTAGLAAYRAAVARGARAIVIEGGTHGTTCARVGCMPSKLLIAAAEAAAHARKAGPFGVRATIHIDGRAVMDRVRSERDRFVGFVIQGVESIPESDKLHGKARFVGPGLLQVNEDLVEARAIVIATGSSPFVPSLFDAVREHVVVNDDVFGWEALPESVAVFGAGVIGLELGEALSRLGVRVRIFGRGGNLGPLTDPAVAEAAAIALGDEVALHLDARVLEVQPEPGGIVVRYEDELGVESTESFAYALVATGRRPNLTGLGLEHAGLALDERGIPVFDRATMQCGTSQVFIAGDVNHELALLHEAADEGRIAGENAARFPRVAAGARRSRMSITFTEPQLATVGASWRELSKRDDVVVGEVSFHDQGRSRVMLQNRGHLSVYAERGTGRFLGAEMAGPRAEHIAHLLAWAHQQDLTIERMLAMPFYHPVVEEGLRTALRDAAAKNELAQSS